MFPRNARSSDGLESFTHEGHRVRRLKRRQTGNIAPAPLPYLLRPSELSLPPFLPRTTPPLELMSLIDSYHGGIIVFWQIYLAVFSGTWCTRWHRLEQVRLPAHERAAQAFEQARIRLPAKHEGIRTRCRGVGCPSRLEAGATTSAIPIRCLEADGDGGSTRGVLSTVAPFLARRSTRVTTAISWDFIMPQAQVWIFFFLHAARISRKQTAHFSPHPMFVGVTSKSCASIIF
ncbi:hypothetical protein BJ166DRAFT_379082 [Pestalotiopsis sp. NC0098]|nr:hypothetical protein BJ166DRAFT_379082 [Pestalotiopsis sp. NC0098]